MAVLSQSTRDGDKHFVDSGDDDLERFSGLGEVIREGSQAWVVMCHNQGHLEHHVPTSTATTGDGAFPAKCSAVVCARGQSRECGRLPETRLSSGCSESPQVDFWAYAARIASPLFATNSTGGTFPRPE